MRIPLKIGSRSQSVGSEYISNLVDAVVNNQIEVSLYLIDARITADDVKRLGALFDRGPPLVSLVLGMNSIGDEGAMELAKQISGNTTLRFLDVQDNNIGVLGMKALAAAVRTSVVKTLVAQGNCLDDEGLAALENLESTAGRVKVIAPTRAEMSGWGTRVKADTFSRGNGLNL